MDKVDDIVLNYSDDILWVMNICLMLIMFSVALDMKLGDFKRVLSYPKAVLLGLTSQILLLPLMTLGLIYLVDYPPSIYLGLLMIASCPGGNMSNFATYLSNGNTALSVTLTSIVTLSAVIITPITFQFWSSLAPGTEEILSGIHISFWAMFKVMVQLILIPLSIGIFINERYPAISEKIKTFFKRLAIFIYVAFIIGALAGNIENIVEYLYLVFFIVIVHNVLAMLLGYQWARLNKLDKADARALCFETGIQNAGLGLILIFTFFEGLGGMIIIAAWWGIWDLISSFALSMYWKAKPLNTDNL